MNQDQITGLLRALLPVLTTAFVAYGLDNATAGLISGVLVGAMAAGWSWYTNRVEEKAKTLAAVPGVQVVVGPEAPAGLQTLAANPAVPGVVSK